MPISVSNVDMLRSTGADYDNTSTFGGRFLAALAASAGRSAVRRGSSASRMTFRTTVANCLGSGPEL